MRVKKREESFFCYSSSKKPTEEVRARALLAQNFYLCQMLTVMDDQDIGELESLIAETRWNNGEAIILINSEVTIRKGTDHHGESNKSFTAVELELMKNHLLRIENKFDEFNLEIQSRQLLQDGPPFVLQEYSKLQKWYNEEIERKNSVMRALNDAILRQQGQEAMIRDLKLKNKILLKDQKKAQHSIDENTSKSKKLEEKCKIIRDARKVRLMDSCTTKADTVEKKRRLSGSSNAAMDIKNASSGSNSASAGLVGMPADVTSSSSDTSANGMQQHDTMSSNKGDGVAGFVTKSGDEVSSSQGLATTITSDDVTSSSSPHMSSELPKSETLLPVIPETQPPMYPSRVIRKTPIERRSSSIANTEKAVARSATVPKEDKYIGRTIVKNFFDQPFEGKVVAYKRPFYIISYVDGDLEELDESEVIKLLVEPL